MRPASTNTIGRPWGGRWPVGSVLGVLLCCPSASPAAGRPAPARLRPPARPVPLVLALRRPGLRSYEKVIEEFRGRVGADVRVLSAQPSRGQVAPPQRVKALRRWLEQTRPNLVFAVGQSAYDFACEVGLGLPLLHVLVYHRRDPTHQGIDSQPPAQAVMLAFSRARPGPRVVVALHGPETRTVVEAARAVATSQGIELVGLTSRTPDEAVRRLRKALAAPRPRPLDGIWLVPDQQVLTPQVFQYAVSQQFRRGLLLMGATRQHVSRGALFAVDLDPSSLGRQAAERANDLLLGSRRRGGAAGRRRRAAQRATDRLVRSPRVRLSVNQMTARRLAVPLQRLSPLDPEVLK